MIHRLLYRLTAKLPCRLINIDNKPYLERYYLGKLLGVTFYLHRFVSADCERHLHNHPWGWGRALVLTGSYTEERVTDICPAVSKSGCLTTFKRVRWWNRVDGNHFHRISAAELNTWTLFYHGPRVCLPTGVLKGWGFLENAFTVGYHDTTVFRTHSSDTSDWWLTSPKGRESQRIASGLRPRPRKTERHRRN